MGKNGLTATEIGNQFGLAPRTANWLLKVAGVLDGEPGAWRLTEKGAAYGTTVSHENGYGGYAYRQWETMHYDPKMLDDLDVTESMIDQARAFDATHRVQKALQLAGSRSEAENEVRGLQEQLVQENGGNEIDWAKVALLLAGAIAVTGGVIIVVKYGPALKRR